MSRYRGREIEHTGYRRIATSYNVSILTTLSEDTCTLVIRHTYELILRLLRGIIFVLFELCLTNDVFMDVNQTTK